MNELADLVTVFRSMDLTAKDDSEAVVEMLRGEGLNPVILDDSAPGVPAGTYEVRTPANEAARAEELIAEIPPPGETELVDDSAALDLETIYHSEGNATAEIEAMGIKQVLAASGIEAVIVGDAVLPNMPFEVRVARELVEEAKRVLADAERSGPADADEAELAGETQRASLEG